MEKQASKLLKAVTKTAFLLSIFTLLLSNVFSVSAQDISLANGKQYVLGEINVTGTTTYNKNTILTYTGLKKGETIYLPGDKISSVVKKLWELGLFKDINFYITKIEGNVADLELNVLQVPVLNEVKIAGVSKSKNASFIKDNDLSKGTKVTENLITTTKNYIRNEYRKKGYLHTKVLIATSEAKDSIDENSVNMAIRVDKGNRVKIDSIAVVGNDKISDAKIRKYLKKTKRKNRLRFWKRSKFVEDDYKEGKEKIIEKYKEKGYRDARIVSDSIIKGENNIALQLNIEEGKRYYFGEISFIGNSVYTDEQLARELILKKGDVYNGVLLDKRIADNSKPDANDITNLYQNNGYFFSRITPVETRVHNDTIDFEVRIVEGKLTRFDRITATGNTKTNDHVLYRNIRTRPGEVYSKEKIIRTLRELGQTNFFDTEQLVPNIKNPDPNSGTIDVEYNVVEKGASQFELQGGFGGTGFIGTLGLSFNNFSIKNIFNKESYQPLPSGDGQSLALRAQVSQSFRTYSLSFAEPWLGGKKPFQLSVSFRYTKQFDFDFSTRDVDRSQSFTVVGGTVGIAKRLSWPDDFFTLSQSIGFRQYNLDNFQRFGVLGFNDGVSNDLTYTFGLSRNNTSISPIFPISGSNLSFSFKTSIPYSYFGNTDWDALDEERRDPATTDARVAEINRRRFKFLEYYKINFQGDWYTSLPKKFVLKSSFRFGFLGAYNSSRGVIPFERFQLGGSGLGGNNSGIASVENISLRGYPDGRVIATSNNLGGEDLRNQPQGRNDSTIFNKFSLELRYPISSKPAATIYGLAFLEGGAAFDNFKQFNPFQLNRSAGAGIRIFMPAFGLLGIDFAHGFDSLVNESGPHGWETHFVLGQQF